MSLNFSHQEIIEMFSWPHFDGFTADRCSRCRKTANVPQGPSWRCECGHDNILDFGHTQILHETPDQGPTSKVIKEAFIEFLWGTTPKAEGWRRAMGRKHVMLTIDDGPLQGPLDLATAASKFFGNLAASELGRRIETAPSQVYTTTIDLGKPLSVRFCTVTEAAMSPASDLTIAL